MAKNGQNGQGKKNSDIATKYKMNEGKNEVRQMAG